MSAKTRLAWLPAAALLFTMAQSAMAVTIINQFPAIVGGPPLYFVEGVAAGGGKLYYTNSEELFELDPVTGAEIRRQAVSGYINDLEWVNGELWAARMSPPSIVRFNPATFAELGSFDTSAAGIPEGVTFDGTVALFSVDGPPAEVFELDPTTGAVGNPRPSRASDPEALTFGDGAVWEAGKDEGRLYKVDRQTGAVIAVSGVPSPDIHGLDYAGGNVWATSYANRAIYEFGVDDVNADPTLSWVGTTGYVSDGVDPDSGNSLTQFDFRVRYTDLDNDAPWWVLLYVQRDGAWMTGTPFIMSNISGNDYRAGPIFSYTMRLAANSTYRYFFAAQNEFGDATGPPTGLRSGPIVSDQPPVLAWAGTPGFTTDGVEPDVAQPNTTPIEFRVLYTATVPAQYVRVHVLRDGAEMPGSPHDMATADTSPADGALYAFQRTLPRSRQYTYFFEAFDGLEMAGGLPTTAKDGPIVGNRDPVLDWTGLQGFETDGVDPDVGSAMQTFRFKVRYQDADNDWPAQVLLHIARAGTEIAGSPVDLSRVPGAKPRQGVVYRGETVLGRGKNYTHWFEANDGFGPAVGPATAPQAGPVVNSPPYLEWVSTDPWEGDGVTPDTGTGRTRCVFRVVYRDLDNDAPTQVLLELRRYRTVADPRSPLAMVQFRGGTARDGLTFRRALWLNPGVYWYRFVASDGFSAAQGVPTQWTRGPVIDSGAAAAQITSATAVATGRGAQITFSLSTPATVRAEVLNVAGRPVRTLAPKDCDAGSRTLLWDGMSAAGLPVPDGLYLISLTARDAGGGEARALSRVYLRR